MNTPCNTKFCNPSGLHRPVERLKPPLIPPKEGNSLPFGAGLSSSIPVREYRPVENVSHGWLHSVRNASCGWIALLPSDAFLTECPNNIQFILELDSFLPGDAFLTECPNNIQFILKLDSFLPDDASRQGGKDFRYNVEHK
jgi:hypothetical protein